MIPFFDTPTGGSADTPLGQMVGRVVAALIAALVIAWTYRTTHRRDTSYAPTFTTTLVLLAVLIAVVTQVIGDSVARAFSLVGALSIVRFRTVVADTRDTAFVIFVVVVGMAAGTGKLDVALLGLIAGCATAFLMHALTRGAVRSEGAWKLTVRIALGGPGPRALEAVLAESTAAYSESGTATTRQGAAMDLTYQVRLKPDVGAADVTGSLNRIDGVMTVALERL